MAQSSVWAGKVLALIQAGNSTGAVDLSGVVNGPTVNALTAATLSDSFFDKVTHIGAVKDSATNWTSGWMFGN